MDYSYSITLMDDQIPLSYFGNEFDETKIIPSSVLKFLLSDDAKWEETALKSLVKRIVDNDSFSNISAFTNPNFYFNHFEDTAFTPEVIIFDWNYPGGPDDSKEILLKILEKTFTVVFIFTGVDEQREINDMINSEEFSQYKNRLGVIHKGEENAVDELLQRLEEIAGSNFSFKFGSLLRHTSQDVINSILVELGKVSINQIGYYLQLGSESRKDLVEFIGERFKNHLVASDALVEFEFNKQPAEEEKEDLGPKIWSHRLYYYELRDKRVRKGDVVKKDDNLYLIITADCDLSKHWHKNFGYVSLVPLHKISEENEYLKNQMLLTRTKNQVTSNLKVTSLANKIGNLTEGPILLPFLESEEEFHDYILFPKELYGERVEASVSLEKGLKNEFLRYNEKFKYSKVASISEPFLTPVIQHVLHTIGGYGTPDYPKGVQQRIKGKLADMFSEDDDE